MRILICILLYILNSELATAQDSIRVFGATVRCASLNSSIWEPSQRGLDSSSNKFVLMYTHSPILDKEGISIQPVIAVICEELSSPLNVIDYSLWKRKQVSFIVDSIYSKYSSTLSYWNGIGYAAHYGRNSLVHKLFVGHFRHKHVGVQVICDSTEGVYEAVEQDFRSFLRSVTLAD